MDLTQTQPEMPKGTDPYPMSPDSGADEEPKETPEEKLKTDIEKHLKDQAEESERELKTLKFRWKRNVELRLGNPLGAYSQIIQDIDDEYQSEVNPDWYLTKQKTSNLFSQVPKVILTHENQQYAPAIGPFAKSLNYELSKKRCNAAAPMFEILNDVVNASGIGGINIGYAARFEDREVPTKEAMLLPPLVQAVLKAQGQLPTETVPFPVDYRFFWRRISPVDLLRPKGFVGSDYNDAPWVGERFKTSWSEVKADYKLDDEIKERLSAAEQGPSADGETLQSGQGSGAQSGDKSSSLKDLRGKRLYYWRHKVDPDCLHFDEIWEIVWLEGIEEPIYHDPWRGQRLVQRTNKYVGATRLPIQVLTTTYITDNPAPPSDSEAGRPQVNDMRRSRSQTFQNRAFSKPVRWFNTDVTDPTMHDLLMRGQMQGMIPVQGSGEKAFGEIARASYPAEDFNFDRMTQDDLYRSWMIGPNQMGLTASHEITKAETQMMQGGFATTMGQERGRVADFFLGCVEVMAGLMALYSDFPNLSMQEKTIMRTAWDSRMITVDLAFKILPDSQVVLDVGQQIQRTNQLLNLTAKSGFVNVQKLIVKLIELHGEDPAELVIQPQPHPVKPASLSFSFKGREDLQNPLVLAMLMKNQQLPSPDEVAVAQKLLTALQSGMPIQPPQRPGMPGQPQRPGLPAGPRPAMPPSVRPGQDAHPNWSLASKIAKRSRDV